MKQAVTAMFVSNSKVFMVKRQDFLKVFPGYLAFPGGKIDDFEAEAVDSQFFKGHPPKIIGALLRELQEELGYDLIKGIDNGEVRSLAHVGNAITPEFNFYRFDTYFFRIEVTHEIDFKVDLGECQQSFWMEAKEVLKAFRAGKFLMVPPTRKALEALELNIKVNTIDFSLDYDVGEMVPFISPIYGITQFLPLSNTFPPALRTNAFLIGDFIIDPSPKNLEELMRLEKSFSGFSFRGIFITHHHPDHHEYSTLIARKKKLPMAMSEKTYLIMLQRFGEDYFAEINLEFFKEGDLLTYWLGRGIYVFEVPGHDEGQLALAPKSMEWFLVGDLIQTVGTVVIGKPEGDMSKYFATLQRVIDLNPGILIPSHGICVGGTFKLKETLDHRQLREKQILALLAQGKSQEEILAVIYKDIEPNLIPYAVKTIECHLEKINQEKLL